MPPTYHNTGYLYMDAMVWHPASFCLDTIKSESVIQMPVHILLNQKQQILYMISKKKSTT